jgi:uncharacterized protein YndB with AHSA1/START domain
MIDFTIDTEIKRPVADVFAYATDPEKLSSWQTNTVSVTREDDGEYGLGSRLREVHAGPRGKHFESVVEVSEYEPDRTFALRLVEGQLPIHAHITFEPGADGTLMHFRVHGQPRGATRLMEPLLRRVLKKQFTGYCQNLERLLENGSVRA